MLNQSIATNAIGSNPGKFDPPETNKFRLLARQAGLVATEFFYIKDEEIYGEDEPGDYVYQVIRGAVRAYKLLSDGRRQIGAFYLPGDIFGLESGPIHRLTAEAIIETTVRLVTRPGLEKAAGIDVQVARKTPAELAEMVKGIPVGRVGLSDEAAHSALFLASRQSGYITGETLSMSGGRFMD